MKLSDLLHNLPHPLRKIIESDEKVAYFLREGLALSEILLSERTLTELLLQLKPWEKRTLELIVHKFASHLFELSNLQFAAKTTELTGAELRAGIAQLRRKGILFAMRKSWGDNNYFIPSDSFETWQKLLMNTAITKAEHREEEVTAVPNEYRGLAFDLFFILSYISFHEITLTKKHAIPKRHINNLAEIICLDDARMPAFQMADIEVEMLQPPRVPIVLAFATRLNLIKYGPIHVLLKHSEVQSWLLMSNDQVNRRLYSIFKELFYQDTPAIMHFLTKIEAVSSQRWHLTEEIVHWMQEYDIIMMFNDWMGLLTDFGFIENGINNQGKAAFRWMFPMHETAVDTTSAVGKLYVQPDYEVLVPPDVSFSTRWQLAYFADHLLTEQVGVYRLTEQSLRRALNHGRTAEVCIDFLTKASYFEVPEHIKAAILHWTHGQESVSESVNRMEIAESDTSKLIKPEQSGEMYNIESSLFSRGDIYPSWQEIPSIWWKECRQYHGSTRREIIKQAINWQTRIKLRYENKEWLLIPESLQESEQGWSLAGRIQAGEVVLDSGQWQEMQLVLPGFYELDG